MKRKVIIVTDGDRVAKEAVEVASKNINGRCISLSYGNPTMLSGEKIVDLIHEAKYDPVVVMVDDRGNNGIGLGEKVMGKLFKCDTIEVIGVIAVASNTPNSKGVKINCSIDKDGKVIFKAVDKFGNCKNNMIIKGDTVNSLSQYNVPYIVGVGDPGKMDGSDNIEIGAPIITKAMEQILKNAEEIKKRKE